VQKPVPTASTDNCDLSSAKLSSQKSPGSTFTDLKVSRRDLTANQVEQHVRMLLNDYPNISDADAQFTAKTIDQATFQQALSTHLPQRMIPCPLRPFPDAAYQDAGTQPWQPVAEANFLSRIWFTDIPEREWFKHRMQAWRDLGDELRDAIHPILVEKLGSARYSLGLYGTSVFREAPGRDLDVIAVNHDPTAALQIFGSQEIEVPALLGVLPWLQSASLDLNVIPAAALQNSESETSMAMLAALSGCLFLVGGPPEQFPPYMRLMQSLQIWCRQTWSLMQDPDAEVPDKMQSRVYEVLSILKKAVDETEITLEASNVLLLPIDSVIMPEPEENTSSYFTRISRLIGALISEIDYAIKERIQQRVLPYYKE
jgi:hypothetical protein